MKLINIKGDTYYIKGGTNTGVVKLDEDNVLIIDPGLGGLRPKKIMGLLKENNMNENNLEKIINNIVGDAIVKEVMSLKLAVKLIETVEEKAAEMGLAVVVAVSDASGRPIAVHCMDGAYHGSFDVAVNKTYTSTAFQMSTAKLSRLCQPGQDLYGLQFSNNGKVMILGGGEPLMVGRTMIGALGVSGGSAQEDSDLAAYGASALKEVIKCL